MSIPSKIQDTEKLRRCYVDEKLSTREIANRSEELFGVKVCSSAVYNSIVAAGIPLRERGQATSAGKSTLDPSISHINEPMIEWVDGFLLGDGHIDRQAKTFRGARYKIGSSSDEWTRYALSCFSPYLPTAPSFIEPNSKNPNGYWYAGTRTHPDIVAQARRWYPLGVKIVPADVRITATSVRLWYLGDGSFTYMTKTNGSNLRLATVGFSAADVTGVLLPKLETLGIHGERDEKGDIRIASADTFHFFDLIGWESPIPCYAHKFEVPAWLGLKRLADIVTNDQEKWRAAWLIKSGKAACTRSPGGKLFLFDEAQALRLRELLTGSAQSLPLTSTTR